MNYKNDWNPDAKIEIAKKPIYLFKTFEIVKGVFKSPFQYDKYNRLYPGMAIIPKEEFDLTPTICLSGIHASDDFLESERVFKSLITDYGNGMTVWLVRIPTGAQYYKSTLKESQSRFSPQSQSVQYRADKIVLVKKVI